MEFSQVMQSYKNIRYACFSYRRDLSAGAMIGMSLAMACVTGVAAQIRIPLAFTPVPMTGQVLAVLLSGLVLAGLPSSNGQSQPPSSFCNSTSRLPLNARRRWGVINHGV